MSIYCLLTTKLKPKIKTQILILNLLLKMMLENIYSLVAQRLKHLLAMWETWVRSLGWEAQLAKNRHALWETWVWSLGWEDPLERVKSTHSSIWPRESGRTEKLSLSLSSGEFFDNGFQTCLMQLPLEIHFCTVI